MTAPNALAPYDRLEYQVVIVPLEAVAIAKRQIVDRGVLIASVYVIERPVPASLYFGQKAGIQILQNMSIEFDRCTVEPDGLFIDADPGAGLFVRLLIATRAPVTVTT